MHNDKRGYVGILILAAGKGERFHGKKQDLEFHGKPLWKHCYDTANKIVDSSNIIVVGKDVVGGETRSKSVLNGLRRLPKDIKKVLILEAARPLVTEEQLKNLINEDYPSVSYVMPLVNTVIGRDGTFYNRSSLYDLLVPQAFDYEKLLHAYETGKYADMTDETRVMYEEYGIKPLLIETQQNLYKVTYPRDVAVLETIYQLLMEKKDE